MHSSYIHESQDGWGLFNDEPIRWFLRSLCFAIYSQSFHQDQFVMNITPQFLLILDIQLFPSIYAALQLTEARWLLSNLNKFFILFSLKRSDRGVVSGKMNVILPISSFISNPLRNPNFLEKHLNFIHLWKERW